MTWAEIQALAERNALFLDQQPDDFLESDARLSEEELILLLWLLIDDFETEDGRIKKNNKNFLLIGRVDNVFSNFNLVGGGAALIGGLITRLNKVVSNNFTYYTRMLGQSTLLTRTKATIINLFNKRVGLNTNGTLKKDGYLSQLLNNTTIKNQVKESMYKGVLSGSKPSDLKISMKKYIVNATDQKGAIEKFYAQYAYDTFGQIDRMSSTTFAAAFKLDTFIYAGTIINTSRAFCRKKIHGIYTIEQAKLWPFESPAPIGIYATYDPIIDMGGVNCRHSPFFITTEMKEELIIKGYQSNI